MDTPFLPRRLHRIVVVAALAAASVVTFAAGAQATTLYDNLASSVDGSDPVFSYGPLADSFTTGAGTGATGTTGVALGSVRLSLTSLSNAYSGTLSVFLLADSATSPGAPLAALGTLPFSAVSTATWGQYTFAPTPTITLSPFTRYWVELTGSGPNAVQWSWSDDLAATGTGGEYSASATLGVSANGAPAGPYQMAVLTAPVPEPTTWLLTATGLLPLIVAARIRRGS